MVDLHEELREDDAALRRLKTELAAVERELGRANKELDQAIGVTNLIERFDTRNLQVPVWTPRRNKAGKHKAIATLHFTDAHLDEVIRAKQILGFNNYDARIAEMRLKALAERTIEVSRDFIGGVDYEALVIISTGDVFSGDIHDELRNTNERPLFEGAVYWVPKMVAFLETLAIDYGRVHVGVVVGNHGRNTHKPIYKNRPQNNIEWLFWHWVADHLAAKGERRITFDIADGLSANMTVYTTTFAYEHGDEFRGGTGIAGARSPLLLGQHRTAVQRIAMSMPLDWLVVGHFHQYQPPGQGLIMGGSLKGYDEYAAGRKFRPEVPQQGFWVTTPERGPTVFAPIQPMDRKREGW